MPFTFSHPALVLWLPKLKRDYFSVTGLVMGSIAPDFEYFLTMTKGESEYSHDFAGVFWFNLPLAILLSFLFHGLVRDPLINHLPKPLFLRFAYYREWQWKSYFRMFWAIVVISVLIGVFSHLLWDWFTHTVIPDIDELPDTGILLFGETYFVAVYDWFHLFNSLAGFIAIFFIVRSLPLYRRARRKGYFRWYWFTTIALAAVISWMRYIFDPSLSLLTYGTSFLSSLIISFILNSLIVRTLHRQNSEL